MKKMMICVLIALCLCGCGKKEYITGTYEAEGPGKNGPIRVSVHVDANGKISKIDILNAKENSELLNKVRNKLIPDMIKENTYKVDSLSGATHSSEGLKEAVKKALKEAE